MRNGFLVLLAVPLLYGCGAYRWSGHHVHDDSSPNGHHNWADDPYFPAGSSGLETTGSPAVNDKTIQRGDYLFRFQTVPKNPAWDEKTVLRLSIYEVSVSTMFPVTGAELACKTLMSPHGAGMSGVIHNYKTHDFHVQSSPGVYDMAILFGVGGTWDVRYVVRLPNKTKLKMSFPVSVMRSGDLQQEWDAMQPESPGWDEPKADQPILPPGRYPPVGKE